MGFVILAHERPQHVARIARHLAKEGAPVVIHYDRRSPGREVLAREAGVPVLATRSGEWGMFGLVAATLDAVRELLAGAPTTRHVCLISGACLPLRPVAELVAFLAEHPETDFIESAEPRDWIRGGLDEERFTLHHPVPWRRRRWLFDRLVHAQRRLGVRRRLPAGLTPRLGRQWWCLTAASLRALLADPRLPAWERFFRTVWIPDESFFQSLIPLVARQIDPRPLTLARFDHRGLPFVFHDDHQPLLAGSDHFFARKIDPDAAGLVEWALANAKGHGDFRDEINEAPFAAAGDEQAREHTGLAMAGRYPRGATPIRPDTARPFAVLVAEEPDLLGHLHAHLHERLPDAVLHGRLFAPEGAEFVTGEALYPGNLPALASLRDYRPQQFLARLVWTDRERPMAFLFCPTDSQPLGRRLVEDPNTRLILIERAVERGALLRFMARDHWVRRGRAITLPPRQIHAECHEVDRDLLARDLARGQGEALDRIASVIAGLPG